MTLHKTDDGYLTDDGYIVRRTDERDTVTWPASLGGRLAPTSFVPKGWVLEKDGKQLAIEATQTKAVQVADKHAHGFWWSRCEAFAAALNKLTGTDDEIKAEVIRLVGEHGLTRSDFIELDERPGRFHIDGQSYTNNAWHRNLRITRNDPNAPLFEVLKR